MSDDAFVQSSVAVAPLMVTLNVAGGSGSVCVAAPEDAVPPPAAFTPRTLKVYAFPFGRPLVMVAARVAPSESATSVHASHVVVLVSRLAYCHLSIQMAVSSVQVSVACASPPCAEKVDGAGGAPATGRPLTVAITPSPTLFTARTCIVYSVLFVSSVRSSVVVEPLPNAVHAV